MVRYLRTLELTLPAYAERPHRSPWSRAHVRRGRGQPPSATQVLSSQAGNACRSGSTAWVPAATSSSSSQPPVSTLDARGRRPRAHPRRRGRGRRRRSRRRARPAPAPCRAPRPRRRSRRRRSPRASTCSRALGVYFPVMTRVLPPWPRTAASASCAPANARVGGTAIVRVELPEPVDEAGRGSPSVGVGEVRRQHAGRAAGRAARRGRRRRTRRRSPRRARVRQAANPGRVSISVMSRSKPTTRGALTGQLRGRSAVERASVSWCGCPPPPAAHPGRPAPQLAGRRGWPRCCAPGPTWPPPRRRTPRSSPRGPAPARRCCARSTTLTRLELVVLDAVVAAGRPGHACDGAGARSCTPRPSARGRGARPAARPGPGLGRGRRPARGQRGAATSSVRRSSGLGPPSSSCWPPPGRSGSRRCSPTSASAPPATGPPTSRGSAAPAARPRPGGRLVDDAATSRPAAMLDHLERTGSDGARPGRRAPGRRGRCGHPGRAAGRPRAAAAAGPRHLVVPREVGLALRGGRTTREPVDEPPPLVTTARAAHGWSTRRRPGRRTSSCTASSCCSTTGAPSRPPRCARVGWRCGTSRRPPPCSTPTSGRRRCTSSSPPPPGCSPRATPTELDAAWLPTDAFDAWRTLSMAERWARLAAAWLDDAAADRAGRRPAAGQGRQRARPGARAVLAGRHPARGAGGDRRARPRAACSPRGTGVPSLVARLHWLRPRRPASRADAVAWAVEEAARRRACSGSAGCPRTAGRCSPTAREAAAAAVAPLLPHAGRPRAAAGRPDRGRARAARGVARPRPRHGRPRRVAGRRDRLPVHRELGPARVRRRLVGGRGPRGDRPGGAHRDAPAAAATSSTTSPAPSAPSGSARSRRSCAATTRPRWPRSCTTRAAAACGCGGSRRPCS